MWRIRDTVRSRFCRRLRAVCGKTFVPLAVPKTAVRLVAACRFDRCANPCFAVSSTGRARRRCPTSQFQNAIAHFELLRRTLRVRSLTARPKQCCCCGADGIRCALGLCRLPRAANDKTFVLPTRAHGTAAAPSRMLRRTLRVRSLTARQKPPNRVAFVVARCKGFEPLTFWFVAKHSIQLS